MSSQHALEQLQLLCSTFIVESSTDGQSSPNLEQALQHLAVEDHPTALRNLLHIELTQLRRHGAKPEVSVYLQRFPAHAAVIRQVFAEWLNLQSHASIHSASALTAEPGDSKQDTPAVGGLSLLGNYRLVREIGRGGMGQVYEAIHIQKGHRVALKTLPTVDGGSLHRFKREFRSAANLNHPNLICLHELESDGRHWFFTMELIQGTDFLSYVRPASILSIERLRSGLAQCVAGLMALHGAQVIHRDLKPSNVLVDSNGRVVILDFGLVHEEAQSQSFNIAGTPSYMAPEQGLGQMVSGLADWYSLGVMLYQALSGRLPFTAENAYALIRAKTELDPPPLMIDDPDLKDLSELAMRLIARQPVARPTPGEIASFVSLKLDLSSMTRLGGPSHRLVGRDSALKQLAAAFQKTLDTGDPLAIFVSGRSGEGKSSLVEAFLDETRHQHKNIPILAGRCYDRESVPFKALDSLIDALASYLRNLPTVETAALVPDDLAILTQLFPVLNRVESFSSASSGPVHQVDDTQTRTRASNALRQLLKRLSRRSPVILFADDLQWGDADSADVILQVLKQPDAPRVLFIGSFRSDEQDNSPFLNRWNEQLETEQFELPTDSLRIGPLNQEQILELTVQICGIDNERVRRRAIEFAVQTGGNPYLLIELISCFDPHSDAFHAIPIDQVIASKLNRLPQEATPFLQAVAVAGQSVNLREAFNVAELGSDSITLLTPMRTEKLLRMIGPAEHDVIDTYHDKIRETVLVTLTQQQRADLHRRFVGVISKATGTPDESVLREIYAGNLNELPESLHRVFDLSYHADAAGDAVRAAVFALIAAEQAVRQFSQTVAAEQFSIAIRNSCDASPAFQFAAQFGYSRALSLAGNYSPALEALELALAVAENPVDQARVLGVQGEIAHKRGDVRTSVELYSEALRRLGLWVPRSTAGYIVALAVETLRQIGHVALPAFLYRKNQELPPKESLTIELTNRNSIASYYYHGVRMLWTHMKGFNLAENYLPSHAMAYTYGLHPAPIAAVGMKTRGAYYGDKAIKMAKGYGDILIEGHSNTMRCMGAFSFADYETAIDTGRRGIDLLTRAGDLYILMIAEAHLALSLARTGCADEAWSIATESFNRSVKLGEDASASGMLYTWATISDGILPVDTLKSCFQLTAGDNFSMANLRTAEGIYEMQQGNSSGAERLLSDGWGVARRNFIFISHTTGCLNRLVSATRLNLRSLSKTSDSEYRRKLAVAFRLARMAGMFARIYPVERARALREFGLLREESGSISKAIELLSRSLQLSKKLGDVSEAALTQSQLSRIQQENGLPFDQSETQQAEAFLSRFRELMHLRANSLNLN